MLIGDVVVGDPRPGLDLRVARVEAAEEDLWGEESEGSGEDDFWDG